jgi:pseudouridine kinase
MRITVIGAANIDIIAKSKDKIIAGDANNADIRLRAGGTARNIASMLARSGAEVSLITAVGDDPFGALLRDSCNILGINTDAWIVKSNISTGVHLSTLDNDDELFAALVAITAPEHIKSSDLTKHKQIINDADLLILDLNLSEKTLQTAFEIRGEAPTMVNAVSIDKVSRISNLLDKVGVLKLNRLEAEELTGISLDTKERVKQACFLLVNKGANRVFITLGVAGVCVAERKNAVFVPAMPIAVRNKSGAGDAFSAGIALSYNKDIRSQAENGIILATEHLKRLL